MILLVNWIFIYASVCNAYPYTKVCLEDDNELLNVELQQENAEKVKMTKIDFMTVEYPMKVVAQRIFVKMDAYYFSPRLTSETKYATYTTSIDYGLNELKEMRLRGQCSIGNLCTADECSAYDQKQCYEPGRGSWLEAETKSVNFQKNPLYWHYVCLRDWTCHIRDLDLSLTITHNDKIILTGNNFEHCSFLTDVNFCKTNLGAFFVWEKINEPVTQERSLTCLVGKLTLCHDDQENFEFETTGHLSYMRNFKYQQLGAKDIPFSSIFNLDQPAHLSDLAEVFRTLQFENLQSKYNAQLIYLELQNAFKLIKSLLLFNLNITSDALENYRASESRVKSFNETHILLQSCRTPRLRHEGISRVSKIKYEHTLFAKRELSDVEYKTREFRVDSYDYDSLNRMLSEQLKDFAERESDGDFDLSPWHFMRVIWNNIRYYENCVFWFFTLIFIVHLVRNRG